MSGGWAPLDGSLDMTRVDARGGEAAISERGDGHRLDPCLEDVWGAGQLAWHDAEMGPWFVQVRPRSTGCLEGSNEVEVVAVKHTPPMVS
jgi:hypothetical protein